MSDNRARASASSEPLPARRSDLVLSSPEGQDGYVVKDPHARTYFRIGEEEAFLLERLDGRATPDAICQAFAAEFGEELPRADLDVFVELAERRGLLEGASAHSTDNRLSDGWLERLFGRLMTRLYWRKTLFDPDGLFTWLEPKIRFFWTRSFVLVSAAAIIVATVMLLGSRQELVSSVVESLGWKFFVLLLVLNLTLSVSHEFAHGLTCKHHGGEVHEIGFLLLFGLPAWYCNVSDAWLIRERGKRISVSLAGVYIELFLLALAVFVWQLALPGSTLYYLVVVLLAASVFRVFFNLVPLIKLDGYYLLSDLVRVPNLRQRSYDSVWRALHALRGNHERLVQQPRDRFLLAFGLATFIFSVGFIGLMFFQLAKALVVSYGWIWSIPAVFFGSVLMTAALYEFAAGEVKRLRLTRLANPGDRQLHTGVPAGRLRPSSEIHPGTGGPMFARRTTGMTAIAILSVLLGGIVILVNVLWLIEGKTLDGVVYDSRLRAVLNFTPAGVLAMTQVIGGVGTWRLKPYGRTLCLVFAVGTILLRGILAVVYSDPVSYLLVGTFYPVILLIAFNLPSWKVAFARSGSQPAVESAT